MKRFRCLALLCFLIIAAAGTGFYFGHMKNDSSNANSSTAGGVDFDKTAVCIGDGDPSSLPDSSQNSSSDASSDSSRGSSADSASLSICFPVYPDVTIFRTDLKIPILLTNPAQNPCLFQFTVKVKDSDNTLLSSGQVSPGKAISGIPLSNPLSQGDYTLEIHIATHTLNGNSEMNGGNVLVELHVM